MAARHPDYLAKVEAFIDDDPLAPFRTRIDLARLKEAVNGAGILHLEHGLGGGLSRHVTELTTLLDQDGVRCFRAKPDLYSGLKVDYVGQLDLPNLPTLRLDDAKAFAEGLRRLPISSIHIHSLVGWTLDQICVLLEAAPLADLEFDFTVHDYASICPRVHMIDWSGLYCDSASADYCRRCVSLAGSMVGATDVEVWRNTYLAVLVAARRVIVPDRDVAARLKRYVPQVIEPLVRPHPHLSDRDKLSPLAAGRKRKLTSRLRVAVIGSIGANKGADILLAMVADVLRRDLPLEFEVIGETSVWANGEWPRVKISGRYVEDEVDALIQASDCRFAFFPAVWPETFCYTLDVAVRNQLACLAFDIGALGRRIKEMKVGNVLPLQMAEHPGKLNEALLMFDPSEYTDHLTIGAEPNRAWRSAAHYYNVASPDPKSMVERQLGAYSSNGA